MIVLLAQANTADQNCLTTHEQLIITMARLSEISLLTANQAEPAAATALMGDMKILIPLAGLIDKEEETQRINKQIEKINQEIMRGEGKLKNEKFVSKAPDHLVAAEKDKLTSNKTALQELSEQLEKLKSL